MWNLSLFEGIGFKKWNGEKINPVHQIADLIVIEALKRPRAKEDVLASIHTVNMEIIEILIDLAVEVRKSERQKK